MNKVKSREHFIAEFEAKHARLLHPLLVSSWQRLHTGNGDVLRVDAVLPPSIGTSTPVILLIVLRRILRRADLETMAWLNDIAANLPDTSNSTVLITFGTESVGSKLHSDCLAHQVSYVDLNGSSLLLGPDFYIEHRVERRATALGEERKIENADGEENKKHTFDQRGFVKEKPSFQRLISKPNGYRALVTLLEASQGSESPAIRWTTRMLAEKAGLSTGGVQLVKDQMKALGLVHVDQRAFQFIDPARALDLWTIYYLGTCAFENNLLQTSHKAGEGEVLDRRRLRGGISILWNQPKRNLSTIGMEILIEIISGSPADNLLQVIGGAARSTSTLTGRETAVDPSLPALPRYALSGPSIASFRLDQIQGNVPSLQGPSILHIPDTRIDFWDGNDVPFNGSNPETDLRRGETIVVAAKDSAGFRLGCHPEYAVSFSQGNSKGNSTRQVIPCTLPIIFASDTQVFIDLLRVLSASITGAETLSTASYTLDINSLITLLRDFRHLILRH